jgi:polysaccharide biosynthesis/export protein
MRSGKSVRVLLAIGAASSALGGCVGGGASHPELPPASYVASKEQPGEEYVIGPLDQLNVRLASAGTDRQGPGAP